MGLLKRYLKGNKICKVTFIMEKDVAQGAKTIYLVGDFNDWKKQASPMKQRKDGSFSIGVDLQVGYEYQYRYLVDGVIWENDLYADKYVPTIFGDVENSVVVV